MTNWSEQQFLLEGFCDWVCSEPHRLLSKVEQGEAVLERLEAESLNEKLQHVPTILGNIGPWVGCFGVNPDLCPNVVVAGICQGKTAAEKANWILRGPTIEAACGLDLSAQVALAYGAEHHIWIVDHEYAATACDGDGGNPERELEIGRLCEIFVKNRFPGARIFLTSNADVRGELYAVASSLDVARLYPAGVRKPYGIPKPSLWDQFDYLACMASMVAPTKKGKRVWAVVDHDQLRPASAARTISAGAVGALLFWPAPQLHWRHSARLRDFEQLLLHIRKVPRRMHRSEDERTKVHFDDSLDSLKERLQPLAETGRFSLLAANEVLVYLGARPLAEAAEVDDCCEVLSDALGHFRQKRWS